MLVRPEPSPPCAQESPGDLAERLSPQAQGARDSAFSTKCHGCWSTDHAVSGTPICGLYRQDLTWCPPWSSGKHQSVTVWRDSAMRVVTTSPSRSSVLSNSWTCHSSHMAQVQVPSSSSLRSTFASSLFLSLLFHPPLTLLFPTLLSTHNRQNLSEVLGRKLAE